MEEQCKIVLGGMISVFGILIILLAVLLIKSPSKTDPLKPKLASSSMSISSSDFADGSVIPARYTCLGANISPPLQIKNIPAQTKDLVLIVHDPDASGGDWLHWSAWNIPVTTTNIAENSLPAGSLQGKNDFGLIKYNGPCPPNGTHRYQFDLYALDSKLSLKTGSSRDQLVGTMSGRVLYRSQLIGTFSNPK